jgi:hypothetical protein
MKQVKQLKFEVWVPGYKRKRALIIIRSIRKDLVIILLGCLIFVFLYDFWLIKIPGFFKGALELGSIFYKICIAYLTAYIFYFLNIFIKSQNDLFEINYFIARQVSKILGDNSSILIEFSNLGYTKKTDIYPSKTELERILLLINIKDPVFKDTKDYNKSSWPKYFNYFKIRTQKNINLILQRSNYLDARLVSIISELEDSEFFMHLDYLSLWENTEGKLLFMAGPLSKYFSTLQELNSYYYEKLFPYIKYDADKKRKL